jgi:hypothetical protein
VQGHRVQTDTTAAIIRVMCWTMPIAHQTGDVWKTANITSIIGDLALGLETMTT